jgi:sugar phosphate isomerase/epimerase
VILGTGQVEFAGVFAVLEERGFHGWIGLEPVEERSARAELAAAIEYVRAL